MYHCCWKVIVIVKEAVKSIKLISGEEIVGVVHDISDGAVEVQGPFSVARTMGSSYILVPWMASSEENSIVTINAISVCALMTPSEEFLDAYVKVINKVENGVEDDDEEDEEVERRLSSLPDTTYH